MPSTPLDDPHRKAPEVASSIPLGPDATHVPPGPREQLAEDIEVSKQHVNLLLPKLTLIRHGQSLFNAMWDAHGQLPPKGQQTLPFGGGRAKIQEGSLIGGIPLIRDISPMNDPRLLDAPLTPHGQHQARAASKKARSLRVDLVLSTPLTRAIQTSLLVFRPNANSIDWSQANIPSLDQPLHNVTIAPPDPVPESSLAPLRIIPYHHEVLCASCDVGVPLSVLESRFTAEPKLDFSEARRIVRRECWWSGAERGLNVQHVEAIKEQRHSSNSTTRQYTLKSTKSFRDKRLFISREQSQEIERRTKGLLRYILKLAVEHANNNPEAHRPLHVALVGHCGFFARLSGHTLENCEILEVDWPSFFQRQALKGYLTLPPGLKHSDINDVTKQPTFIRHWIQELGPEPTDDADAAAGSNIAAASSATCTRS